MSDDDTSSANPAALEAFVATAMQLDARLTLGGVSLRAAIAEFTASCREYPTGVDESLADQVRDLARRNVEMNLWVRQVAAQFAQADSGQSAVFSSASLQSAAPTLADLTAVGSGTPLPLSVGDWSTEQRVEYAIQRALTHLPEELRRQLEGLLTPATLAWMVGILGVWVAGQFFGAGEIADGIIALLAVALLGPEAFRAGQELGEFVVGVAGAQTPDDLDAAGAHLATVVSIVGVDGLMAILAHEAGGALGSAADGPAASGGGGALEPAYARVGAGGGDLPPGAFDQPGVADPLRMSSGSGVGNSPTSVAADPATVALQTYDWLGDTPPRLNVEANDATFNNQGAHTLGSHGPDVPLTQADAPPGARTIESRIYGDPQWGYATNYSYRWLDSSTMNRTINAHVAANWEAIRSDLVLNGTYDGVFDAQHAIGEGFYDASMNTSAPSQAVYHVTSMVRITIKLVSDGNSRQMMIVRAFPLGKGAP